jgi:SpoVK/Ycf46/Vps4 family AAA+-type ATPase
MSSLADSVSHNDLDTSASKPSPARSDRLQFVELAFRSRLDLEAAVYALRMIEGERWYPRLLYKDRIRDEDVLTLLGLEIGSNGGDHIKSSELRDVLRRYGRKLERKFRPSQDVLAKNLEKLGALLKLGAVERAILRLAIVTTQSQHFGDLFTQTLTSQLDAIGAVKSAAGLRRRDVMAAFASNRTLRRSGFLENWGGPVGRTNPIEVSQTMTDALLMPRFDEDRFLRGLVCVSPKPTLALDDYSHLADLSITRRYITDAVKRRRKGANVLIHGAPGTGKTEFVRVLATELGFGLYEVPNEDANGDPISGRNRFMAYGICQNLLANRHGQVLLFDEVEDVFGVEQDRIHRFGFSPSRSEAELRKSWVNQTLEENSVPAFWVCNTIGAIDAAYLRRFDLILEFNPPPRSVRRRIIDRHFRAGEISDHCADRLANLKELVPAHVTRAARVARSVRTRDPAKRDAEIERVVLALLKAAGHGRTIRRPELPPHYDPVFLNTGHDLTRLAEGLRGTSGARLCLYGPPGTGKTAFAHHLGRVLDRPVLVKLGSDLLSMWVGGTEALIAEAFREAREDNALLVIDEADGFLRDRADAERNWEVTQVNELLTQMESFEGTFIASTNLVELLDAASLRRFDFKVKFGYLTRDQRRALVTKVCAATGTIGSEAVWAALDRLESITPGDVANALRQCAITKQMVTVETIVGLLAAEQAMKPECRQRPIGFGT